MLTVTKHLPMKSRWACGCIHSAPDIMPHYCPRHHSPPVIEFIGSGIANLERELRRPMPPMFNRLAVFVVGFALGALTSALAAISIFQRNH